MSNTLPKMSNTEITLVKENNPILHQEMETFDFKNPPIDPKEIEKDLIEFMIENNGVGLSANQLGLPYRVFTFGDPQNRESCRAVFNPRIVHTEGPESGQEEGCLSFPGLVIKIFRPSVIRIRYQDRDGKTHTDKFGGYTARIVQHEKDHLDGIVFTKRAKKFHLDRALKKRKLWLRRQSR